MDTTKLLNEVRDGATRLQTAVDAHKDEFQRAAEQGLKGLEQVKRLLAALKAGDKSAVQVEMTKWADVNETLIAAARMDRAIEKARSGPTAADVADFIGKALKVALTIGMAL